MTEQKPNQFQQKLVFFSALGMVPVVVVLSLYAGNGLVIAPSISAVFALVGVAGFLRQGAMTNPLLGLALIGQSIAMTAALTNHLWQIDSHMTFFAALAFLVVLQDIRTIVAGTVAIALHHLGLTFFMPTLVYPAGEFSVNLQRTIFHAAVVLVESTALIIAIRTQSKLIADNAQQLQDVINSQSEAEETRQEMQAQQEEQNDIVEKLSLCLGKLAKGDVSVRISETISPVYEPLRVDFNKAMEKLQDAMHAIITNTSNVTSSANEISQSSGDLALRTEQQAETLEDTTTSMKQLTSSVQSTAGVAEQANEFVTDTKKTAEASGKIVGDTIDAMAMIQKSADQISTIIGVIDDIAFQTNLLALNAGVEAARAGEAGRGFAVVASEVRALAQRASDAASEIKELIINSSEQVSQGGELVRKTGNALNEIVDKVGTISQLVAGISSETKEQSTGINEVNNAIMQLDQVTQQNAAMAEEATAASHELHRDATELARLTKQFSLGQASEAA